MGHRLPPLFPLQYTDSLLMSYLMIWQKRNKFTVAKNHEYKETDAWYKFRTVVSEVSSFAVQTQQYLNVQKTNLFSVIEILLANCFLWCLCFFFNLINKFLFIFVEKKIKKACLKGTLTYDNAYLFFKFVLFSQSMRRNVILVKRVFQPYIYK